MAAAVSPPQHRRLGRGSAEPLHEGDLQRPGRRRDSRSGGSLLHGLHQRRPGLCGVIEMRPTASLLATTPSPVSRAPAHSLLPRTFCRCTGGERLRGDGATRKVYDRLGALAEAHGVSLFHVLLGALYVYFARTGQVDEVTFGLPVFNRANGAYKRTAGLFVNQSPVKFCAGRDLSFTELLGRISTTLKTVYRHQRLDHE